MKKISFSVLLLLTLLPNKANAQSFVSFDKTLSVHKPNKQTTQKDRAIKFLEQAIKLSEKETHTAIRADMLSSLAFVYVKLGDKNKADKLLDLSRELIGKEDDLTKDCYECPSKEYFKTIVAVNHHLAGETQAGLKMLDEIVVLAKQNPQKKNPYLLGGLAFVYAKFGNQERALDLLSEAFKIAKTMEDNKGDVFALNSIAKRYALLSKTDLAMQVVQSIKKGFSDHAIIAIARKYADTGQFDRAVQLNKLVESPNMKPDILIYVAGQCLKSGNKEKAVTLLNEAMKLFDASNPKDVKNRVPAAAIYLYAEAGEYNQASNLMKRIKGVRILSELAVIYSKMGHNKEAEKLLSEAYEMSGEYKGSDYQAVDLRVIANAYAFVGRKDRASALLSEAVNVLSSLKDTYKNDLHFAEIAMSYQFIGDDENVVKMLERIDDNYFGTKIGTLLALASSYIASCNPEKTQKTTPNLQS